MAFRDPPSGATEVDPLAIHKTIIDAKGDLIVGTAADTPARRAVGANGQGLVADSAEATGVKWDNVVRALGAAVGDVLVFNGSNWIPLTKGAEGHVLTVDTPASSLDVVWKSPLAIIDAKGDLVVGNAADVPARLPIAPFNNGVVVVDGNKTDWVRWGKTHDEIPLWFSAATAAVALQGLDIPAALTEFDGTTQGTRRLVELQQLGYAADLPPAASSIATQMILVGRVVSATAGVTVTFSIRDTSNTANILHSQAISFAAVGNFNVTTAFVGIPSWFTANKTLALYTSGGNGTVDCLLRYCGLRFWP